MHVPVIIGVGQRTHRPLYVSDVRDPARLMLGTVEAAIADATRGCPAGSANSLRARLNSVRVVFTNSWEYEGGNEVVVPALVQDGARLCPSALLEYSPIGGETPQKFVIDACLALERGEIGACLLTGAETAASLAVVGPELMKGPLGNWPAGTFLPPDTRDQHNEAELLYKLTIPARMYPLIETAIRARSGRSPADHVLRMGRVFERYAAVAAVNPDAVRTP